MDVMREITPLTQSDCFTLFSRIKKKFDFPLHYHDEYELNLILNAKGARRIVGDHIDVIDDLELVFVGPNQYHAWFTHECTTEKITEITIQFHKDLFDEKLLNRINSVSYGGCLSNPAKELLFHKIRSNVLSQKSWRW